jgi:hypothetical protein
VVLPLEDRAEGLDVAGGEGGHLLNLRGARANGYAPRRVRASHRVAAGRPFAHVSPMTPPRAPATRALAAPRW